MKGSLRIAKLAHFPLSPKQKQLSDPLNYFRKEKCPLPLFFKKYFPKNLKEFTLTSEDYSVLLKVKRAKIIQDFEDENKKQYFSENWRSYLRTKMKNIQVAASDQ